METVNCMCSSSMFKQKSLSSNCGNEKGVWRRVMIKTYFLSSEIVGLLTQALSFAK